MKKLDQKVEDTLNGLSSHELLDYVIDREGATNTLEALVAKAGRTRTTTELENLYVEEFWARIAEMAWTRKSGWDLVDEMAINSKVAKRWMQVYRKIVDAMHQERLSQDISEMPSTEWFENELRANEAHLRREHAEAKAAEAREEQVRNIQEDIEADA